MIVTDRKEGACEKDTELQSDDFSSDRMDLLISSRLLGEGWNLEKIYDRYSKNTLFCAGVTGIA